MKCKRWKENYKVKLAVAKLKATPQDIREKVINDLMFQDLLAIVENPFTYKPIKAVAEKVLKKRISKMRYSEQIELADSQIKSILKILLELDNDKINIYLLKKFKLTKSWIKKMIKFTQSPYILYFISIHPKWQRDSEIISLLQKHPCMPREVEFINTNLIQRLNNLV